MVRLSPETDLTAQSRRTEMIALILSVGWLLFVGAFFLFVPVRPSENSLGPLGVVMVALAIFVPVAIIWVASIAARSARMMRAETQQLYSVITSLQQEVAQAKQAPKITPAQSVERKMTKIAQATRPGESKIATFSTKRDPNPVTLPTPAGQTTEEQPTFGFDPQPDDNAPPLPRVDLIRALNFPDTEADSIGFVALRKALKDPTARRLVQASQDVLTLLSQDGIYMDDLESDRSRPELWRRFAQGERGRAVGALGGVRDRTSLALTTSRMREDPIFRDAAHHFLRHFDKMLTSFESVASDAELVELSNTRTARAFMLLGRVTGAFD